ncbi:MAG: hypothetical protein JO100_08815 [Pseudonocardia sp.]|jgi:hypothetical protein|nr:hypothetical protein [Pseudonocardia sp.]
MVTAVVALGPEETILWQVSLAIGAVVIIVVIALLGMLLALVRSIEQGARELLGVGAAVAGNTSNISTALTIADTLDDVATEAGRHAALLGVTS